MCTIKKKVLRFIQGKLGFFFLIALSGLLSACSVVNVQKGTPLSSERWMILPFQNYSQSPRAGEQVEQLLATLFRIRGVSDIAIYQPLDDDKGAFEFNERRRQEKALSAIRNRASYAVTGSVDEWQYKLGVGSEPAVGLTIQIIEIPSGKVVWSASGARSGWSTGSLSGTAQNLLKDMISSVEFQKS